MNLEVTVKMEVYSCNICGIVYGVPSYIPRWRSSCPMCAADKLQDFQNDVYELSNQVRGLKSALTRMKKERGK